MVLISTFISKSVGSWLSSFYGVGDYRVTAVRVWRQAQHMSTSNWALTSALWRIQQRKPWTSIFFFFNAGTIILHVCQESPVSCSFKTSCHYACHSHRKPVLKALPVKWAVRRMLSTMGFVSIARFLLILFGSNVIWPPTPLRMPGDASRNVDSSIIGWGGCHTLTT